MAFPQLRCKMETNEGVRLYVPLGAVGVYAIFGHFFWARSIGERHEESMVLSSVLESGKGKPINNCTHLKWDGELIGRPGPGPMTAYAGATIPIVIGDGITTLSTMTIGGADAFDIQGVPSHPHPAGGWMAGRGFAHSLSYSFVPDTNSGPNFGAAWFGEIRSGKDNKVILRYVDHAYTKSFYGSGTKRAWNVTCELITDDVGGATFLIHTEMIYNHVLVQPIESEPAYWEAQEVWAPQEHSLPASVIDCPVSCLQLPNWGELLAHLSTARATITPEGESAKRALLSALEDYKSLASDNLENVAQLAAAFNPIPLKAFDKAIKLRSSLPRKTSLSSLIDPHTYSQLEALPFDGSPSMRDTVVRLVRSSKRGFHKFAGELQKRYTANIGQIPERSMEFATHLWSSLSEVVADIYLWKRYTLDTFQGDVLDWVEYASKEIRALHTQVWGATRTLRGKYSEDVTLDGLTSDCKYRSTIRIIPYDCAEFIMKPLRAGLKVGYETGWNVIPLSFTLDWVWDISTMLQSIDWLFYRNFFGLKDICSNFKGIVTGKGPNELWSGKFSASYFERSGSAVWPSVVDFVPAPRSKPFKNWYAAASALLITAAANRNS